MLLLTAQPCSVWFGLVNLCSDEDYYCYCCCCYHVCATTMNELQFCVAFSCQLSDYLSVFCGPFS